MGNPKFVDYLDETDEYIWEDLNLKPTSEPDSGHNRIYSRAIKRAEDGHVVDVERFVNFERLTLEFDCSRFQMEGFRRFFEKRMFWFYPDADATHKRLFVSWEEAEFRVQQYPNERFGLGFTLVQVRAEGFDPLGTGGSPPPPPPPPPPPGPGTAPTDAVPNAVGAWGTYRLRSAYTGSLMTVRRVSDGAQTAIFADGNGDLDTTTLESFSQGGDVEVVTLNDQIGFAHLNVVGAAPFPLIVESGTTITLNDGRAGMRFDSDAKALSAPNVNQPSPNFSAEIVFATSTQDTKMFLAHRRDQAGTSTSHEGWVLMVNNDGKLRYEMSDGISEVGVATSQNNFYVDGNTHHLLARVQGGEILNMHVDGNAEIRTLDLSGIGNLTIDTPFMVGEAENRGSRLVGDIVSVILWNRTLTASEANTLSAY